MSVAVIRDACSAAKLAFEAGDQPTAHQLALDAVAVCLSTLGESHYAFAYCLVTAGWTAVAAEQEAFFRRAQTLAEALAASDFENAVAVATQVRDFYAGRRQASAAARLQGLISDWHEESLGDDHLRSVVARAHWRRLSETTDLGSVEV